MPRRFPLVVLTLPILVALAPAAPVPPETDAARLLRLYGTWEDPDKDCRFELRGDRLRLAIPSIPHDFDDRKMRMNPPRVLREVEGDFTVSVRVDFSRRETLTAHRAGEAPRAGAGILVWASANSYLWMTRSTEMPNGVGNPAIVQWVGQYHQPTGTGFFASDNGANGKGPADLRVQRVGEQLSVFTSPDGIAWDEATHFKPTFSGKVRVGVFVQHNTTDRFEVVFDKFTLTVPKK